MSNQVIITAKCHPFLVEQLQEKCIGDVPITSSAKTVSISSLQLGSGTTSPYLGQQCVHLCPVTTTEDIEVSQEPERDYRQPVSVS